MVGPYSREFFKPVDSNDYSQLQDIHDGLYINENGQSSYTKRQWPSDHLWYKAVFILDTNENETTKPQYFTPQFDNVEYTKEDDDIQISFNLTNLHLWDNDINYVLEITDRYQHATIGHYLQRQSLDKKPLATDTINILVTADTLNHLIMKNEDLQIRYTSSARADGYHKIYAVKTIPLSVLTTL